MKKKKRETTAIQLASKLIEQEIKWCEENPQGMSQTKRNWFINGLKQALGIVDACLLDPTLD